jgi:hypothetical protein
MRRKEAFLYTLHLEYKHYEDIRMLEFVTMIVCFSRDWSMRRVGEVTSGKLKSVFLMKTPTDKLYVYG